MPIAVPADGGVAGGGVASATPGGVGGWRAGGAAAGAVMGAVRIAMVGASSAHGTPKGVSQWVGEEQVLASFCVRGSVCRARDTGG